MTQYDVTAIKNIRAATQSTLKVAKDAYDRFKNESAAVNYILTGEENPARIKIRLEADAAYTEGRYEIAAALYRVLLDT